MLATVLVHNEKLYSLVPPGSLHRSDYRQVWHIFEELEQLILSSLRFHTMNP